MTPASRAGRRAGWLVLALAVAVLVAILALAVRAAYFTPGPGGEAADLVPASALAFARLDTSGDAAAEKLARLAPRLPGYVELRDAALEAVSPAPGAFDPARDVEPWLGDEAAVALVDLGGGRFGSLVLASVRNRPRAEALLQRVAGARPAVRYRDTVVRRFGTNGAAFVDGFLVAGPQLAVQRSIDVARGEAQSLASVDDFDDALSGAPRAAQVYLSARGLRGWLSPQGGVAAGAAAALDRRDLRALGAVAGADDRGLRLRVRAVGAGGEPPPAADLRRLAAGRAGAARVGPGASTAVSLAARVPADAVALLAGPDAAAAATAAERVGLGSVAGIVRDALAGETTVDADRDLLARLDAGFAAWVSLGEPAPRVGLALQTDDPQGMREALAQLQAPIARAAAEDPDAPPVFRDREIAGADAFSLPVSDGFAPSYAVVGETAVLGTSFDAVEAFLARGTPRLLETPAFRAAVPELPPGSDSLGFFDVRQLLALGEQTGLTAEDLRPVHAASAVIQREEDDTTAELFFEIP
jgi:hypothetical protein